MAHNPEVEGYPRGLLGVIARHPDVTAAVGVAVILASLADNVDARHVVWELSQKTLALSDPGRLIADVVAALAGFSIMSLPTYIRPPKDLQ